MAAATASTVMLAQHVSSLHDEHNSSHHSDQRKYSIQSQESTFKILNRALDARGQHPDAVKKDKKMAHSNVSPARSKDLDNFDNGHNDPPRSRNVSPVRNRGSCPMHHNYPSSYEDYDPSSPSCKMNFNGFNSPTPNRHSTFSAMSPNTQGYRSVRQIMRFCGRDQSKSSSSMSLDFPSSPRKRSCCLFGCTKAKVIEFITGRIGGELEPRTIDLKGLAQRNGHENWEKVPMQDQAMLIHQALSSNLAFLIDPTAGYMKIWDIVIMTALLFTCLVTPFEVGFILPLSGSSCGLTPLSFSNRVIDVIFLKDMIMQFYLKVEQKSRRGTVLLRDRRQIIQKYLSGWFLIDFLSIIPYDLITCWSGESLGTFRIFRLLRLLKLARIFRASRLFKRWQDHISLSFASIALAKFGIGILLLSHWTACVWGLVGLEFTGKPTNCWLNSGDELVNPRTNQVSIVASRVRNPYRDPFNDWSSSSWVKNTFVLGSYGNNGASPTISSMTDQEKQQFLHADDPCLEFSVYVIALHWSVMTITSIGYGDVTPTHWNEYLTCVIVMFIASFSWAYVMGNACSVIMNMDPVRVEFEQSMDQLNSMMKEQLVPPTLQRKLRENMREAQNLHRLLRSRELSKDMAPSIKCELIMHTSSQWIKDVTFLRGCSPSFILELVDGFDVLMFARKEKINMPYVRLCVVERGAVGRAGKVMVPGSVWGEDVILADRRLQHVAHTTALTFVQLLSLGKEQLDNILRGYPRERRAIRKIACKLALRRAASLVASYSKKKCLSDVASYQGPRLLRIFDSGKSSDDPLDVMNSPILPQKSKIHTFDDLLRLFSQEELQAANERGPRVNFRGRDDNRGMESRIREDINSLQSHMQQLSEQLQVLVSAQSSLASSKTSSKQSTKSSSSMENSLKEKEKQSKDSSPRRRRRNQQNRGEVVPSAQERRDPISEDMQGRGRDGSELPPRGAVGEEFYPEDSTSVQDENRVLQQPIDPHVHLQDQQLVNTRRDVDVQQRSVNIADVTTVVLEDGKNVESSRRHIPPVAVVPPAQPKTSSVDVTTVVDTTEVDLDKTQPSSAFARFFRPVG
ncbi:unnamed protein product [Amoebophrya sp. A120]|nr:unnamed protein product [Amoebophrya sp. A120]|eukprot:GSA120T00004144001.1